MFLSRILCPPRFKELLLSYRKTIRGAALLEVGLILCYLEYVALRTDTQFFYSGDHHWSNSVDLAGCQLSRFNFLVTQDLERWLNTLNPETPTYDYLSGHLDRQVWNFAVATAGVTHLGEDLGGLPFWGPDVAARGILLRVLRRGALVVFLGLGCYLWVRR